MKRESSGVAGAISVLLMTLIAMFAVAGCGSIPENAAATVNGVVISKDEVTNRINVAAAINPQNLSTDPDSEEYKLELRDFTEQLVAEEIERQEAEKRGLSVSTEEIDEIISQVIEDKYFGSYEKMEEDFARRGLTDADLRNEIWRRQIHQKMLASIRDEIPVTDDEVLAQYESNKENYVYPEKRQTRQIVVADQAAAQSVADRLAAGEDFTTLARDISIDARTKQNGGLVGLVPQSALPKEVGEAAFALQSGQVSTPVKSDLGWYVVSVDVVTPPSNLTFDDVKEELKMYLGNQRLAERFKIYSAGLESEYDIQYADDYSPRELPADVTSEDTQPLIP